jgi:hypothetical protein
MPLTVVDTSILAVRHSYIGRIQMASFSFRLIRASMFILRASPDEILIPKEEATHV